MSWFDKLVDKARGYEEIEAQPHAFVGDEVKTIYGPGKVVAVTGDENKPFEDQQFKVDVYGDRKIWMGRRSLQSDRYLDGNLNIVYY